MSRVGRWSQRLNTDRWRSFQTSDLKGSNAKYEYYPVKAIIDHRHKNGKLEYLVRWDEHEGQRWDQPKYDSWERIESFTKEEQDMIDEYHAGQDDLIDGNVDATSISCGTETSNERAFSRDRDIGEDIGDNIVVYNPRLHEPKQSLSGVRETRPNIRLQTEDTDHESEHSGMDDEDVDLQPSRLDTTTGGPQEALHDRSQTIMRHDENNAANYVAEIQQYPYRMAQQQVATSGTNSSLAGAWQYQNHSWQTPTVPSLRLPTFKQGFGRSIDGQQSTPPLPATSAVPFVPSSHPAAPPIHNTGTQITSEYFGQHNPRRAPQMMSYNSGGYVSEQHQTQPSYCALHRPSSVQLPQAHFVAPTSAQVEPYNHAEQQYHSHHDGDDAYAHQYIGGRTKNHHDHYHQPMIIDEPSHVDSQAFEGSCDAERAPYFISWRPNQEANF